MQMFVGFQPNNSSKSMEVLTYFSHCLNAEIREGRVGQIKGWMFIFKDELRPFNFGGKRKYSVEVENAVAQDIRAGKSLRQISRERNISPTTVHTIHKRYLARNPEAYQFLTREHLSGTGTAATGGSGLREKLQTVQRVSRPETNGSQSELDVSRLEMGFAQPGLIDSYPETVMVQPEPDVPSP